MMIVNRRFRQPPAVCAGRPRKLVRRARRIRQSSGPEPIGYHTMYQIAQPGFNKQTFVHGDRERQLATHSSRSLPSVANAGSYLIRTFAPNFGTG